MSDKSDSRGRVVSRGAVVFTATCLGLAGAGTAGAVMLFAPAGGPEKAGPAQHTSAPSASAAPQEPAAEPEAPVRPLVEVDSAHSGARRVAAPPVPPAVPAHPPQSADDRAVHDQTADEPAPVSTPDRDRGDDGDGRRERHRDHPHDWDADWNGDWNGGGVGGWDSNWNGGWGGQRHGPPR